jgi:hypothetical protein
LDASRPFVQSTFGRSEPSCSYRVVTALTEEPIVVIQVNERVIARRSQVDLPKAALGGFDPINV